MPALRARHVAPLRWALLAIALLAAILVPFFLFEPEITSWTQALLESERSRWIVGALLGLPAPAPAPAARLRCPAADPFFTDKHRLRIPPRGPCRNPHLLARNDDRGNHRLRGRRQARQGSHRQGGRRRRSDPSTSRSFTIRRLVDHRLSRRTRPRRSLGDPRRRRGNAVSPLLRANSIGELGDIGRLRNRGSFFNGGQLILVSVRGCDSTSGTLDARIAPAARDQRKAVKTYIQNVGEFYIHSVCMSAAQGREECRSSTGRGVGRWYRSWRHGQPAP